jgi:hypothetical protein
MNKEFDYFGHHYSKIVQIMSDYSRKIKNKKIPFKILSIA